MALKSLLILSLQACLFQAALCNAGYGPSLGISSGAGQIGQLSNGIGIGGPIGPNPALGPGPLGPAGPSYGYNNLVAGPGPIGHGPSSNSPFSGYGGSGSGDVAVAGELPVAGSTIVAGQVPIIGGVQFGGSIPAVGTVTITGTCSCGSPYGY